MEAIPSGKAICELVHLHHHFHGFLPYHQIFEVLGHISSGYWVPVLGTYPGFFSAFCLNIRSASLRIVSEISLFADRFFRS